MTTARRLALAAVATLAVALPTASRAESYLMLKGGVYVPTASEVYSAWSGVVAGKLPTGGDVELAAGFKWGILGAQIGAGYLWSSNETLVASGIPFTGVLQLRLPIFFIQPYLEAGIGGLVNFVKPAAGGDSQTKLAFVAVGGVGVDFELGPVLIGAEGRYLWIAPQDYAFAQGTSTLRMSGVIVTANVGYVF
jgi:hypothetical protein